MDKPLKQIAGMSYSRSENGIHVYRFRDNRRESVDGWFEQSHKNDMEAAARSEPVSHMLDLRGNWITPYALARALQNARRTPPGLKESTAVIAGDTFVVGMIQSLMRQFPSAVQLSTRVFRTEEPALTWLLQRQQEFRAEETSV
jgi:hypothetical protein